MVRMSSISRYREGGGEPVTLSIVIAQTLRSSALLSSRIHNKEPNRDRYSKLGPDSTEACAKWLVEMLRPILYKHERKRLRTASSYFFRFRIRPSDAIH